MLVETLEQTVYRLVKQYAWLASENRSLSARASLTELGLDSMNINSLAMDLERELDITLPDSFFTAETFDTIETLTSALLDLRDGG